MKRIDQWTENTARLAARRLSRRGLLGRVATVVLGLGALPLLPVARASASSASSEGSRAPAPPEGIKGPNGDPTHCDYWRHCAIDGFLCSCCGGSHKSCPPGTEMSPVSWVGTCRNPADGKDYVIWYNDCCGKSLCGRCFCNRNEGDRPVYHPYRSNDINWCGGASSQLYNCSTAMVIGLATEAQPEK
jgi:methylamine dehydrogenase light chain